MSLHPCPSYYLSTTLIPLDPSPQSRFFLGSHTTEHTSFPPSHPSHYHSQLLTILGQSFPPPSLPLSETALFNLRLFHLSQPLLTGSPWACTEPAPPLPLAQAENGRGGPLRFARRLPGEGKRRKGRLRGRGLDVGRKGKPRRRTGGPEI